MFLTSMWLVSCGARQKEKSSSSDSSKMERAEVLNSEKESNSKSNLESNIKKTNETIVDDKNQTVTETVTVEPIDPTQPSSYTDENGKKQDLNNTKKTKTKTIQNNNTKASSRSQENGHTKLSEESTEQEKAKSTSKENLQVDKETDDLNLKRESFPIGWIIFSLVVLAGICWIWYRSKNKVWWV